MSNAEKPLAVVLGDIDMLRPLALAGIPCAVCCDRGALPRYSRYAESVIEWFDPWQQTERLIKSLVEFGSRQETKPVLFYESDADLLMISRNRATLGEMFRFIVPEPELTEDLVDKLRFQNLAKRLALPVPRATVLAAATDHVGKDDLEFPIIVKPLTRRVSEWSPIGGLSKAVRIETPEELSSFRRSLGSNGIDYLAQEMIPGKENMIESYHVYVDASGRIAGDFSGKKIRTFPAEFGQSCALTISDADDVTALGKELIIKLNFRGVAKFDFKRAPDGTHHLLEINPRFSLWHHLGAVAGVNLPHMVYCDLLGLPRPDFRPAFPGTNWCRVWQDYFSARAEGVPLIEWFKWMVRCEAKPGVSKDDPMPLLGAALGRVLKKVSPTLRERHGIGVRVRETG